MCKIKAALRLGDFCDKGGDIPAAALAGRLPVPATAPREALALPPAAQPAPAAPVPASGPAPDPTTLDRFGLPRLRDANDICKRTEIAQIRDFCENVPVAARQQQASLTPPPPAAPPATAVPAPAPVAPAPVPGPEAPHSDIGIGYIGITPNCGRLLGVTAGSGGGIMVRGFATGSTGEKAGLRRGDIIIALNGEPLAGAPGFRAAMLKAEPGQTLKLTIWRDNAGTALDVETASPAARPQDQLDPESRAAYQVEGSEAILARLPASGCQDERTLSTVFLGGAHSRRAAVGGAADESERAIEYLTQGLPALQQKKYPAIWAAGQTQLGDAYRLRTAGSKGANIERAIAAYEEAILVRDAYVNRNAKGATLLGLGLALLARDRGDRSASVERAIGCFEQAQQLFNSKTQMRHWADLHRALAGAYLERREAQREQNLAAAIAALETASAAYSNGVGETSEKEAVQAQLMQLRAQRIAAPQN